jgi:hypothetical protein
MMYSVEMGLGAMIYIPSFIKIDSGIQNKESRLKRMRWAEHVPHIQRNKRRTHSLS